ncbi:calycin-like domain-containing protein [Bacteroides sp. 51]|uniref:calycin-like domain-containing protein n=1 Tax=Bacteroides sp. 51 TaxID=2302938 RepID=UPI0013D4B866|nr:calycin-like domain-containing protein [Bacteroides sp. 51]NDV82986.1 hypothetical protein [Bacteroides sp. 51]
MKIKNFLAMMVVALCIVACSSDDDGPSPAQSVAGAYKGYVIMDSPRSGTQSPVEDQTVTITTNEDGTATVNYTSSTSLGTSTISAAIVTATTNGYTISGTGVSTMAMNGTSGSYDCTLAGTINADKSDVKIVFTIPTVMGGTTITFQLGNAPENLLVAGKYSSYSSATSPTGAAYGTYNDESITLKANTENGKVDFTYSGQWGEGTATDLEVSKKDGSYIVSGSGNTVIRGTEYKFTIEGTISADKSTASFVMTIALGGMGTVIVTTNLGDAPAAMLIAGAYNGTLDMSVMGASQGSFDDSKVTIKAQEDGKVEVTLAKFGGDGAMAFTEDIVMKDIELTIKEDTYTLAGTVNTTSATASGKIDVTGTLSGTIKDGKANFLFKLKPGAMPMFLDMTFESK